MGGWTVLGAPLDSGAAGDGEEAAPAALREAGLVKRLGARDLGDVTGRLRPAVRDEVTGVIAIEALRQASADLCAAVAGVLERGERPLVLGGDCSLLPGALAGAARPHENLGLWFIDGHADFLAGFSSPTGEAADMDLAIVTGCAGSALADLVEHRRPVAPKNVVILGHRPADLGEDVAAELARVPAEIGQQTAEEIRAAGPSVVGRRWASCLTGGRAAWLHIDLDALDAEVMPAVSYPQPRGLTWEELEALAGPFFAQPALAGVSVADLNSHRDPHQTAAGRVVDALTRLAG